MWNGSCIRATLWSIFSGRVYIRQTTDEGVGRERGIGVELEQLHGQDFLGEFISDEPQMKK